MRRQPLRKEELMMSNESRAGTQHRDSKRQKLQKFPGKCPVQHLDKACCCCRAGAALPGQERKDSLLKWHSPSRDCLWDGEKEIKSRAVLGGESQDLLRAHCKHGKTSKYLLTLTLTNIPFETEWMWMETPQMRGMERYSFFSKWMKCWSHWVQHSRAVIQMQCQ